MDGPSDRAPGAKPASGRPTTTNSRIFAALALLLLAAPASAIGKTALLGAWEAARSPEDERRYVTSRDRGRVEMVAEYDLARPGTAEKRRGRSTHGKGSVTGDEVSIRYAKVRDQLRYAAKPPLSEAGLPGTAAGLMPTGAGDPQSRIRGATLWKAPHDHRHASTQGGAAGPAAAGKAVQ